MRQHALLSASGAKRWMSCPPSAQLEETLPEGKSEYADEGTFAHALAELELGFALKQIDGKQYKKRRLEIVKNPFYSQEVEQYIQEYLTLVMERVAEAKTRCNDPIVALEQKLDFSQWVPEGFGTGDVVIIADGILEVIDLKYGKGVPVSASHNPQLMLYGIGALTQYDGLYDIETVRMTIIQPRLDNVSPFLMPAKDLYKWADNVIKPKAEEAIAGKGDFKAGEHCQFCKAKATCRARAEANLELAKYEFKNGPLLSDEEIGSILIQADELQAWASTIKGYALDQAENHGKKWDGWKLVEGRSNRCYSDKEAVAEKLIAEGYAENIIYEKSLYGITAMEKILGKKLFEGYLTDLIIKPAGKPTLVLESDKRPEINSAKAATEDFKNADADILD